MLWDPATLIGMLKLALPETAAAAPPTFAPSSANWNDPPGASNGAAMPTIVAVKVAVCETTVLVATTEIFTG